MQKSAWFQFPHMIAPFASQYSLHLPDAPGSIALKQLAKPCSYKKTSKEVSF